jgi:hypothetical protein
MTPIQGVVQKMIEAGAFNRVINNPLAMFGTKARAYKGAELLPEVQKPENAYTEELIEYRTLVANDGTRYSPAQKKSGVITGSMKVELGYQDVASEFTAAAYDALIRLLEQVTGRQGVEGGDVTRVEMQAMSQLIQWAEVTLNRPLLEVIEKQRWQAIIDASVVRIGDNGYGETVTYPNVTAQRVAAGGAWSDNTYDLYADIMSLAEVMAAKGYTVNRILTTTNVRSIMTLNTKMANRAGRVRVQASDNTVINAPAGRAQLSRLNDLFSSDDLPPIELYDLQYRTNAGYTKFMSSTVSGGVMVMVCTTGRDQTIDRADAEPIRLENTLGYVGVGRAAGQATPGRVSKIQAFDNKPPRIDGEAWQSSLPVIMDPEAIGVIRGIS